MKKGKKVAQAMHDGHAVEEEENFPRGGGSGISPVELKRIREEAEAEVEREIGGHLKKRKKRKSDKSSIDVDEDDFFKSLSVMEKVPKFVELLKFKAVKPGMKFWGMITEISPTSMAVSLPHGLRGTVILENASDYIPRGADALGTKSLHLNAYFSLGSYVRCSVVDVAGQESGKQEKKKIFLSTKVSSVNKGLDRDAVREGSCLTACVKSVEDHGYIVDFGIKGTTGFLMKKNTVKEYLEGSILDVMVKSMKHEGHAIVTGIPKDVDTSMTNEWSGVSIGSLLPGYLVNAKVGKILSDGIVVSFLTFFNGTVDPFHLGQDLAKFQEGQKVKARILFCDVEAKKIGLSLLPHLVKSVIPKLPSKGDVYDDAIVKGVYPGLGVSLNLPCKKAEDGPDFYSAFAHISDLSDSKIDDIDSRFKSGQIVKCRVIGLRPIDGLASASLKPTIVDGSLLDISAIQPGLKVSAVIEKVDEYSMIVKLSPTLKASVPAIHFSDAAHKRSHKKFKVGQTISGRVLEVNKRKKKIVITLKKTLVDSKLPILASIKDASAGMKSYGVVTGIKDHGIFVTFFNCLSGLIGNDHLGIKSSETPHEVFTLGQIIKVRVLGVNERTQRLKLTLLTKQQVADLASANGVLMNIQPGEMYSGTIKNILKGKDNEEEATGYVFELDVPDKKGILGRLDVGHLSDHPAACQALSDSLTIGSKLEDLVVLERLDSIQQVKITNKNSIRTAVVSGTMPDKLEDLKVGNVIPGYIASVSSNAVFVRFLDHLSGRVGLSQLADSFVANPASLFHVNMSVRACVTGVDTQKQQFSASLKQSICTSGDASYIKSYIRDMDVAYKIDEDHDENMDWAGTFPFGSTVDVVVHGRKEYGVLCDFEEYPDLVGLLANGQAQDEDKIKEGSSVSAIVMDVSKKDGIIDLCSLNNVKSAVQGSDPKNPVKEEQELEVVLRQCKSEEGYYIVSLPKGTYPPIGHLCVADFNDRSVKEFNIGQKLEARVTSTLSADTGHRLLLVPKNQMKSKNKETQKSGRKRTSLKRGTEVDIKIDSVHATHADVTVEESNLKGTIHISQVQPNDADDTSDNPLRKLEPGSTHKGFVIGMAGGKPTKPGLVHISLTSPDPVTWKTISKDDTLTGYVHGIKNENIVIAYSPFVKGRAFIPDQIESLPECKTASSTFKTGMRVKTRVLSVDPKKHSLEVSLEHDGMPVDRENRFKPGTLAVGYITKANSHGVTVKLSWNTFGVVNLTDIYSVAVKNALNAIKTDRFVQVSIVSQTGNKYSASLRPSSGAVSDIDEGTLDVIDGALIPNPSLKAKDLSVGSAVSGYVKSAGKMGVFVSLGRAVEARIKLRQLQDDFVEDPETSYPPGLFVQGTVMTIQNGNIDITLRKRKATVSVEGFSEGQIVNGVVKRIEKFGVFVSIKDSPVTGLAHVSELSDGYVQDVFKLFSVGQDVKARVITVDTEGGKLSLGLKPSYFELGDESDSDDGIMDIDQEESDIDEQLQELQPAQEHTSGSSSSSDNQDDDDDESSSSSSSSSDEDLDDILAAS
ncbi:hypothetical protein M9435_000444 [Picochlorum sp. BPE23]|nr:hypothetical protein M9435_000444 [Picochlorum sp. BPE23]